MDTNTFVIRLLEHAAWPAVVLIATLILARPAIRLINSIRSVEISKGAVKIRREVRRATESTKEALREIEATVDTPIDVTEASPATSDDGNPWYGVAQQSPAIALLQAWEGLSVAVFELASATVDAKSSRSNVQSTLAALHSSHVVNESYVEAVNRLRELRNGVAHGRTLPSPADAIAFVTSAWELVKASQAIAKARKLPDALARKA
jgi:hypothetical protein